MAVSPEEVAVMKIAADLTIAATTGLANIGRTPDPTLADPVQRSINLEVWEVFRAYYFAVSGALASDKDWTPPAPFARGGPVLPSNVLSALSQPAITALLAGNPNFAPLVDALKGIIQLPAPAAPQAPLPNPGTPPLVTK